MLVQISGQCNSWGCPGRGDSEVYFSPVWLVGFRDQVGKESTQQYLLVVFILKTVELNGRLFFIFFRARARARNPSVKDTLFCPSSTYLILNRRSRFLSFPSSGDDYPTRIDGQCKRAILAKVKQERKGKKNKRRRKGGTSLQRRNRQNPKAAQHFCRSVPRLGRGTMSFRTKANLRGLKVKVVLK